MDGHTICILEGSVSGFGFYSEYEEKTLNFKKITLAAREITGEEIEQKQPDQLRGDCSSPSGRGGDAF